MYPTARIYVNGKLVYEVIGTRNETESELHERVTKSITVSVGK